MPEDIARLGRYVIARRDQLDMNQLEVSNAGGPSNSTLTGIENGIATAVASSTLRKLDLALRWERGSARDVLSGGEPRIRRAGVTVEVPFPFPPDLMRRFSDTDLLAELARRLRVVSRLQGGEEPELQEEEPMSVRPYSVPDKKVALDDDHFLAEREAQIEDP